MVLYVTVGDDVFQDVWVLDSGCPYHMCLNRDVFSTYKSIECGVILMCNDMLCKILGIGTVKIKILDRVLKTLTGVRHVFDLKMNFISLGELDSRGCTTFVKNKSMRIFWGDRVALEARNVGNVYVLLGNTYAEESTHMSIKLGSMIEFNGGLNSIILKDN